MAIKLFTTVIITMMVIISLTAVSCGGEPEVNEPQSEPSSGTTEQIEIPEVKIMSWDQPPEMMIDTDKKYTAIMETVKGNLELELFAKNVPNTVNNFVFLSREGYYDGTTFHRVLPGFMVQGGDPTGTGSGGPGYRFADEFSDHRHGTGVISMANSGANTNGSQFFITYSPQPHLDGKHSVFGQLTSGMEVLKSITPRDPNQNPQFEGDKIIKITILEE